MHIFQESGRDSLIALQKESGLPGSEGATDFIRRIYTFFRHQYLVSVTQDRGDNGEGEEDSEEEQEDEEDEDENIDDAREVENLLQSKASSFSSHSATLPPASAPQDAFPYLFLYTTQHHIYLLDHELKTLANLHNPVSIPPNLALSSNSQVDRLCLLCYIPEVNKLFLVFRRND